MQGRQNPGGEPWDKPSGRRSPSLNGTNKQRSIPQRPPGMVRVSQPPPTPRVARPQRQAQPRSLRQRIMIIGGLFVVCGILACVGSFVATNFINGLNASNGAATTATDFLSALSNQSYQQAYKDLGAALTFQPQFAQDEFIRRAQNDDRCYGNVTNYSEVPNSAVHQGDSQSYTYNITRSKLTKPYQLRLTLKPDPDDPNSWKITDYGNDLGPRQPSATCK